LGTPVNIVSQEQIVGVRRFTSDPEKLQEVWELTMQISYHRHRSVEGNHV
jgi:hypothetical protein